MTRFLVLAGAFLLASSARAQLVLTFDDALERARQTAPAVLAARLRIDEANARVLGASLPFSTNPTLDLDAGPRSGSTSSTDYAIAIGQDIDLPARRRARRESAGHAVAQETQRALEIEREVMRDVATAMLRAIAARERVESINSAKRLADEALQIAERRYAAGDVAQLDVNLAKTAVARAEVEARGVHAELQREVTRVQVLLGIAEPVTIAGSLRDARAVATTSNPESRPDIRALDAEIAEVEAEQRLARTLRWPDVGIRASYSREEGDRILLGGIGLTLPVFQRGQEATAFANARLTRLRAERDARVRAIESETRGAIATHDALREASSHFERTVLPLLEENERLALESYDAGQIGLGELLLVQRESLDARRAFLEQLIETRLAEVELRAQTGVWK